MNMQLWLRVSLFFLASLAATRTGAVTWQERILQLFVDAEQADVSVQRLTFTPFDD
jgi:hypothetical protein